MTAGTSLRSLNLFRTLLIACAVSAPRPAAAAWPLPSRSVAPAVEEDQESASQAETHFASGHRLYQLGRYEEAVAELRRGYELRAEPRFLREIAECYRELGVNDQALFYYDRYLATAPDAPDRKQVEARAADLEALLAPPPPPPNGLRRPVLTVSYTHLTLPTTPYV